MSRAVGAVWAESEWCCLGARGETLILSLGGANTEVELVRRSLRQRSTWSKIFSIQAQRGSSEKYKTDMKMAPPRLLNYQQLKLLYFEFKRRSFDQLYIIKLSWPRFYLTHTDTELDDVGLMWVIRLCYFHLMSIARRLFLNRHLCTISPLRSLKRRSPRVWEWK